MAKNHKHTFTSELWLYPGDKASWIFASVPKDLTKKLDAKHAGEKRGFGSLKVEVTLGETTWQTSIFPDKKQGEYLLPVKAKVRQAEGVFEGDVVKLSLKVL